MRSYNVEFPATEPFSHRRVQVKTRGNAALANLCHIFVPMTDLIGQILSTNSRSNTEQQPVSDQSSDARMMAEIPRVEVSDFVQRWEVPKTPEENRF